MNTQSVEGSKEHSHLNNMELVKRCARHAELAIVSLWDDSRKTFWRSTEHRAREKDAKRVLFFPTVSLRCANALLCLVSQAPDWSSNEVRLKLLDQILPRLVTLDGLKLKSTLDVKENPNIFTLSLYIKTFSQICHLDVITSAIAPTANEHLQSAVVGLINHKSLNRIGHPNFRPIHPFILYHLANALHECKPHLKEVRLKESVDILLKGIAVVQRNSVERLLAKHHLRALAPSESVALAFCAGTLMCLGLREDLPYVLTSLTVSLESQDSNGAWPLGRVVRENKDITTDKLEIPTFEIASVITNTIHELLNRPIAEVERAQLNGFVNQLLQSALYAERSLIHITADEQPQIGWCTDHAYESELIESWTSAAVLLLMLNLRRLLEETHRQEILRAFVTVSPNDQDWPIWLKWYNYLENNEIDHSHPVLKYLDEKVVKPK